jgi:hypothetical protein
VSTFPIDDLIPLQNRLKNHPIYASINSSKALSLFMQHHVYSVWDFMSLIKYLQGYFAPTTTPWQPSKHTTIQRFINDIVLEEESDESPSSSSNHPSYTSHFQLYTQAMEEIERDSTKRVYAFIQQVASSSFDEAKETTTIPPPSKAFMEHTFSVLKSNKPHVIAAAFALGREHIIPLMFRQLLQQLGVTQNDAKAFYYYLDRHIELDGDHHGPLSLEMLNTLCDNDPQKIQEAKESAIRAIEARIAFWDQLLEEIEAL